MADLKITDKMLSTAKSNKCVGWIYLDPVQFLSLTVTDHNVFDWIEKELPHTKTVDDYNSYDTQMPWLDVDVHTGKVVGHEGRHRAAACVKSKVKRLPVAICLRENGYPVYYRQPYIDDRQNPKQLKKVFVTKSDVPKVLIGQFVHRSLLIDTNHMHEFWASHNASMAVTALNKKDSVIKQIKEIAQGKSFHTSNNCWQQVGKYIEQHNVTAGTVILFGEPDDVLHVILLDTRGKTLVDRNNKIGYYDPSKKGYTLLENPEHPMPIVESVPVPTLLQPIVESASRLTYLKIVPQA